MTLIKHRKPWGHESRRCIYCGKVGPRCWVIAKGYAHRRCIKLKEKAHTEMIKAAETFLKGTPWPGGE